MANEFGNYAEIRDAGGPQVATISEVGLRATGVNTSGKASAAISTIPFDVEDTEGFYVESQWLVGNSEGANFNSIGIVQSNGTIASAGGNIRTASSVSYQEDGNVHKFNPGSAAQSYAAWGANTGHRPCVFVKAGKIWFGLDKNAGSVTWNGDPDAGTGEAASGLTGLFNFVAYHYQNSSMRFNFGAIAFLYSPPTGGKSINTAKLPTPSLINYEEEYFIKAGISHSNGSTTAVTLPKNVSGGAMVRIKETDAATDYFIFDTVRGVNKSRKWNEAEAESTDTFDDQNLTGTTFTMPSDLPSGTYLLECFYVGDFFQIQTFTGNAGARTITWPSAMDSYGWAAFFPRTGASSGIQHHKDIGAQQILFCDNNSVAADRTNFSQAPNKTDFRTPSSVGPDFNLNNIPYVCYGWANSGPYQFGTYEGSAGTDGTFINIGGFATVMVVKNVDSAASYQMVPRVLQDSNTGANASLQWDNTGVGGTAAFDVNANGAKMRTANVNFNTAETFIYMAFGIRPLTDGGVNQVRAK